MKHHPAVKARQSQADPAVECASPPCLRHELDPDFFDWTAATPPEPMKNPEPVSLAQDRETG